MRFWSWIKIIPSSFESSKDEEIVEDSSTIYFFKVSWEAIYLSLLDDVIKMDHGHENKIVDSQIRYRRNSIHNFTYLILSFCKYGTYKLKISYLLVKHYALILSLDIVDNIITGLVHQQGFITSRFKFR